jgi:uncharacterized protein YcbK (DUF882 family)
MLFSWRAVALAIALPVVTGAAWSVKPPELEARLGRAFLGRSGALRAAMVMPGERIPFGSEVGSPARYRWVGVLGTRENSAFVPFAGDYLAAPEEPGVYELEVSVNGQARQLSDARIVVLVPSNTKSSGKIGGYRIGSYPEGHRGRYAPPEGYIEVTRENQRLKISEHFTLREFLTHDQQNVWPKYVVVSPRLLDKLELVLDELNESGVPARRMVVMSGFRTPQYNKQGLSNGRAKLSRHQYGDAADVWVDNDGDWYMDDLNGDGRRDTGDARVMLRAVEKVERKYPELLGGAGIYRDNGAHGPFIHIDTRGSKARW